MKLDNLVNQSPKLIQMNIMIFLFRFQARHY